MSVKAHWRSTSALTALVCLFAFNTADATTPGWVKTHTQAINLAKATPLGAVDPAKQMRISVALQMQNTQQLKDLVQQQATPGSPYYGTAITPAQFNATYAPSAAAVSAVQSYLSSNGFSNIAVEPNHLFVTATGTAAQVVAAFNTTLAQFKQKNKTVFVNTKAAQVPASLGGIVLSVLGLNNVPMQMHFTECDITTPTCLRFSYDPATYWKAYNVGSVAPAKQTSIAIMAEGDVSKTVTDLRTFETAMGLPKVPVTVVQVGLPSPDTAGVIEWNLDTQYTTGMAGAVKNLYIYTTTSLTTNDTALEFNRWATQNVAQVANASFGLCEFFSFLDGSMIADDQVFLQAAAQGQTMFSSTGDTGSFCPAGVAANGAPVGAPFVNYPAAAAYVIGVGGTTLVTNADGSYNSEVAWNAGGGGISQFEYSPWWQSPAIPTNNPTAPFTFRAIPDISMDADPNTGAIVYMNGEVNYVGGTSLSSPLAAGAWARLLSNSGNTLGYAGPRFYAKYPAFGTVPPATPDLTRKVDGFRDVLTGTNVLFTALPYYDLTTGLGTIDVAAKRLSIKKQ